MTAIKQFREIEEAVKVKDRIVHCIEAGKPTASSVLFLHGASFSAKTWKELGSLKLLAERGYRAIALDLPGYGSSESFSGSPVEFLSLVMEELNLNRPILISPSMSGRYSLPFIVEHSDKLRGFVAIAPVDILKFKRQLQGINLPVLAIWGSNDKIIPVAKADELLEVMPAAQKVILPNAGHACYMTATDEFHDRLIQFIDRCSSV